MSRGVTLPSDTSLDTSFDRAYYTRRRNKTDLAADQSKLVIADLWSLNLLNRFDGPQIFLQQPFKVIHANRISRFSVVSH